MIKIHSKTVLAKPIFKAFMKCHEDADKAKSCIKNTFLFKEKKSKIKDFSEIKREIIQREIVWSFL